MKLATRIKIALEMCVHEKKKFVISILVILIAVCMIVLDLFIVINANSYRYKVQKGFNEPLERMIYYSVRGVAGKDVADFINSSDKIASSGVIMNNGSWSEESALFLKDVQKNHEKYMDNEEYLNGNYVYSELISYGIWDALNIELLEGIKPDESYYNNDYDVELVYISEEFESICNWEIGKEINSIELDGQTIVKYIFGGYISQNSVMPDAGMRTDEQLGFLSFSSMKYGIICAVDLKNSSGYAVLSEDTTFKEVKEEFGDFAKSQGADLDIYSLSEVVKSAEIKIDNSSYYLNEIMIILICLSLISVVAIQIFEMLTRADEYGIWIACKATTKDLISVIFIQNLIRTFIALIVGGFIMYIVLMMIYGGSYETALLTKELYLLKCVPIVVVIGIAMVFVEAVIPAIILYKAGLVNLLKGELSK